MERLEYGLPYNSTVTKYGDSVYTLIRPRVKRWLGITKELEELKMILVKDDEKKGVFLWNPEQSEN